MWGFGHFGRVFQRARAGVVGHQPPAQRGLQVDVGGQHMRGAQALVGVHRDALDHAVHRGVQRLHPPHPLGQGVDAAVAEHRLEGGADRPLADDAWPARVHADHLVVVGPQRHQLVEVALAHRLVELGLDVVGRGHQVGGLGFAARHRIGGRVPEEAMIGLVKQTASRRRNLRKLFFRT